MKKTYQIISLIIVVVICMGVITYTGYKREQNIEPIGYRFLFTISTDKIEYKVGEIINVTAKLKNIGNEDVNVTEMGLVFGTLDFEITTPEGYIIHCLGPHVLTLPRGVKLEPGEEYMHRENITDMFWIFGNDNIDDYNFTTPGKYTIKGIYRSDPLGCRDPTVWEGIFYSNEVTLTITS